MKKKHLWLKVGLPLFLLLFIGGGIVYMVHRMQVSQEEKQQKMVEIATSDAAREVYEEYLKKEDPGALTKDGIIKSYEIDETSLSYNPIGGLMVTLILNEKKELNIDFDLIDNGNGSYSTAYYTYSAELDNLLSGGNG